MSDITPLGTLRQELNKILTGNILDYWIQNSVDKVHGGFVGHINARNERDDRAEKGIILNTRILWSFSAAYRFKKDPRYLDLAARAFRYLESFFKDRRYGGVYWSVNYTGRPTDKRKQIYAQAFTVYALTEYYQVTGCENALNWAIEIFRIVEEHSLDHDYGGYVEAFAEDWSNLDDVRLSEKDANEKKTMNTHLHILEAYTNLIRVWPNTQVIRAQKNLIGLFLSRFVKSDGHLHLFFNEIWESKSRLVSYGHDIEAAWLLVRASEVVEDFDLLTEVKSMAVQMIDATMKEGIDSDGALMNERDMTTGKVDLDRHWWIQAEGLVGFMCGYELTGDKKYIDCILKLWHFIVTNIIDHRMGEWFWRVNSRGQSNPDDEKVGFWKCPYHNTRACIEMINRIECLEPAN